MSNERRGAVMELCKYRARCIQFFVIAASWFLVKFNSMGVVLLYFERLQDKALTSNCGEHNGIVATSTMTKSMLRPFSKFPHPRIPYEIKPFKNSFARTKTLLLEQEFVHLFTLTRFNAVYNMKRHIKETFIY